MQGTSYHAPYRDETTASLKGDMLPLRNHTTPPPCFSEEKGVYQTGVDGLLRIGWWAS